MKKSSKTTFIVILAIIILAAFTLIMLSSANSGKELATTEFFEKAGIVYNTDGEITYEEKGKEIDYVLINTYKMKGYTHLGNNKYKEVYTTNIYPSSIFEEEFAVLKANGIILECSDPNSGAFFSNIIMPLLITVAGIVLVIILMRAMNNSSGKGAMDFGKTKARVNQNVKVRFSDVAGADEEKEELQEVVEFLKSPRKFSSLGAKIPKGVLLVGPPGTGKTLFAKAVAGEANVPFFSISGSDFVEMFVGVGASRVRDIFNTAKKHMPCIIFIDEIDAVGRHRGAGLGGGNDEREQTLNQLLVMMDGFDANDGIIVMAATNRADILDPALLRPGRFDRQIYVNMPDVKGREAIMKVHSRNKPLAKDVNFKTLARMTAGFSGADIANLLNEAAILAARKNQKTITNIDLYEAINKVIIGPQKKSRLVTETDKRITAYHEAGHAILAKLLPNCDPVQEVSIIPRGMAAGYTMTRPDNDDEHLEKKRLLDDIVMTLGGRVAEELIIKDISAGASNDISVVTARARKMVTEWGMSDKIGPVNYGGNDQVFIGRDMQTRANYSEAMAMLIDEEISAIIKNAHVKATELLSQNKSLLDVMARVLIERETIYQEEVDLIMAGKSAKEVMEYMDNKEVVTNPFERAEKPTTKVQAQEEKVEESAVENQAENSESATETVEETAQESQSTSQTAEDNSNENN